MATIQSNIGLVTGVPIGQTVDALMALNARPRDLLTTRTEILKAERVAVTELSAALLSVKLMTDKLGSDETFDKLTAQSSQPSLMSASVTGDVAKGTYSFTPLQTAGNQQFLGEGLASSSDPLGAGSLSFRFGADVQRSMSLDVLGDGAGVTRGTFRVTDRSGASAEIDLATARSVDDVLAAINNNTTIDVLAEAHDDGIRLTDQTGQTASNLKVEEIGGGSVAAALGLAGIDVAADSADGQDMVGLYEDLALGQLNDGNGATFDRVLDDISYTLRDGTTGTIDLSPIKSGSSNVLAERTLGEVLDAINAAEPGKLLAEIAPDGDRLTITDQTAGGGTFELTELYDSRALSSLGIDSAESGGVITGRRILGGSGSVLLSSLSGGSGLGTLGTVSFTDRAGHSETVDLSEAETLEQVVDIINESLSSATPMRVEIEARVNDARTGIELIDTTGESDNNLIVQTADASGTAEALGIAVDADVTSVSGGNLDLQVISQNTRLEDLNGGKGISRGTLIIVDSAGEQSTLNLSSSTIETVGDVLSRIDSLSANVTAEINPTGDGIRLIDQAGGTGTLEVREGTSHSARDLGLLRTAVATDVGGDTVDVIDGSMTFTVDIDADDSLNDLAQKINELDAGVQAMVLTDGSSNPYRLSFTSEQSGEAGELVLDTSQLGFDLEETASGRDALLVLGDVDRPETNVLFTSASDDFADTVPGLKLTIRESSDEPVDVTIRTSHANLSATVKTFVDNYNAFRNRLTQLTAYNEETGVAGALQGDSTALRLDADLSRLLSGRFYGSGSIRSMGEVGISLKNDGTLEFDSAKLAEKAAEDPEAIRDFFTAEGSGVSDRFEALLEQAAGSGNSLLSTRLETLGRKIDQNNERITRMTDRLGTQRERLLLQFYRMETAISKLQNSLNALGSITALAPITSGSSLGIG